MLFGKGGNAISESRRTNVGAEENRAKTQTWRGRFLSVPSPHDLTGKGGEKP